jgi:putative ABC transport system permease protein
VRSAVDVSLGKVALALVLVAVAIVVSRWRRAELESEIGIAALRAFVQLSAMGFVIQAIFDADHVAIALALVAAMVVLGAFTARGRARSVPGVLGPLLLALSLAAALTLGLVVVLGVFKPNTQSLVPVGGMIVGNAMTAAAVGLNRLGEDVVASRREIEAALALGATSAQAVAPVTRRSLRSALIPLIDQTKTTGLIAFPGIMTGLLLGGARPLDAVRLQLILLYTLLGAISIATLVAVGLAQRRFFTAEHQLREE